MKKINWHYLLNFSGAFLIFITGCSKSNNSGSSLYTPTSSDVTATATLVDLQQGRTLYMNHCNACHGLYSPDDYTPGQWKTIISSMGPRTGLPASDITLITKHDLKLSQVNVFNIDPYDFVGSAAIQISFVATAFSILCLLLSFFTSGITNHRVVMILRGNILSLLSIGVALPVLLFYKLFSNYPGIVNTECTIK